VITLDQYFGTKPHTESHKANARLLLNTVEMLIEEFPWWTWPVDPDTGTSISGSRGGAGDGGFRLPTATTGKTTSAHKEGRAVDVYDPNDELDTAITDELLEEHDLYREDPGHTNGWVHLTTRPPGSGKRTYLP